MDSSNSRLLSVRREMERHNLDAYLIPITDPHLGEYVPSHWRIIEWLTGFTGSAANVVITSDFAGLWTDSRYFIQAERELRGSGFELVKLKIPHTPEYIDWLACNIKEGARIGVDGRIIQTGSVSLIRESLRRKRATIDIDMDLITGLWNDRPSMPTSNAFEHTVEFAGVTRDQKIRDVRARMESLQVDYHLLTSLDDVAWLLNIRGNDVNYSPLLTSFALFEPDRLSLFVDPLKIPATLKKDLESAGVEIKDYNSITESLRNLKVNRTILLSPGTTSAKLFSAIPDNIDRVEDVSIPTRLKAVKNNVEIRHIKNVMVKDGVALTKFLFWLEHNIGKEPISEISAADKLLAFRMQQANCVGPSFATIAAYNEHGASPHYCSTPETDVELSRQGIFLLDSGGQYLDGTTDVTRTIALAPPSDIQKSDFTLALKGTINLAMARFPLGTRGYQIEVLARRALWDNGLNYGHGTGHGVGFFLNVHEGPQTIGSGASGDLKTILEPGMLTADEPAIYREGEYGFRTENLILCVEDITNQFGKFLKFETVTLCYIDTNLVNKELLNDAEIDWLNSYHRRVLSVLSPKLTEIEVEWLKGKTVEI